MLKPPTPFPGDTAQILRCRFSRRAPKCYILHLGIFSGNSLLTRHAASPRFVTWTSPIKCHRVASLPLGDPNARLDPANSHCAAAASAK